MPRNSKNISNKSNKNSKQSKKINNEEEEEMSYIEKKRDKKSPIKKRKILNKDKDKLIIDSIVDRKSRSKSKVNLKKNQSPKKKERSRLKSKKDDSKEKKEKDKSPSSSQSISPVKKHQKESKNKNIKNKSKSKSNQKNYEKDKTDKTEEDTEIIIEEKLDKEEIKDNKFELNKNFLEEEIMDKKNIDDRNIKEKKEENKGKESFENKIDKNNNDNEEENTKKKLKSIKSNISSKLKPNKFNKISNGILNKEFEFHENKTKSKNKIKNNEKDKEEKDKEKNCKEEIVKEKEKTSEENFSEKKMKEISSSAEDYSSSSSLPIIENKNFNYSYGLESQRISQEVEEVIKRIEMKKKERKKGTKDLTNKKRNRTKSEKKEKSEKSQPTTRGVNHTAEEYNFILQKNPNNKDVTPYINLEELSTNNLITYTDILLAIMEIGQNSNSYLLAYSSKSKMFWEDVLQYKILKKIFSEFKAETLRKYWNELSKYDSESTLNLIKKNKEYLDKLPSMKLGTIVSTISKILSGKISDFQENQKDKEKEKETNVKKKEVYEQEFQDNLNGTLTKIKKVKTVYNTNDSNNICNNNNRKKFEPGCIKDFNGNNINIIGLQEVYHDQYPKLNEYQYTMEKLFEEQNNKMKYLNDNKKDKKRKLNEINQEDKFIFKSIDLVLEGLCKEFNNYSKDYILEILQQNSMNIVKTYICLKEPIKSKILGYTPLDDKIIINMKKGEEFNNLMREKGKKSILEREEYLSN